MCPACAASAGVMIGGVLSTGGVTALVARVLGKKKNTKSDSKKER